MGSIRFILFAILIWLVWRMIQKFISEQKAESIRKSKKISSDAMVICAHCDTHLPQANAISHKNRWFCDKQHKDSFINKKSSEK